MARGFPGDQRTLPSASRPSRNDWCPASGRLCGRSTFSVDNEGQTNRTPYICRLVGLGSQLPTCKTLRNVFPNDSPGRTFASGFRTYAASLCRKTGRRYTSTRGAPRTRGSTTPFARCHVFRAHRRMSGWCADKSGEEPQPTAIELHHLERRIGAFSVRSIDDVPPTTVRAA